MQTVARIFFLVLGESQTFGINGSFGSPRKRFSINFSKANFLHYNADHSYLFVNEKEIFKFKADSKNATLQLSFVSKSYLMDLVLLSLEKYL